MCEHIQVLITERSLSASVLSLDDAINTVHIPSASVSNLGSLKLIKKIKLLTKPTTRRRQGLSPSMHRLGSSLDPRTAAFSFATMPVLPLHTTCCQRNSHKHSSMLHCNKSRCSTCIPCRNHTQRLAWKTMVAQRKT